MCQLCAYLCTRKTEIVPQQDFSCNYLMTCRLKAEMMPEGRLKTLFFDRSNSSREDKPPKSTELVARSDKP